MEVTLRQLEGTVCLAALGRGRSQGITLRPTCLAGTKALACSYFSRFLSKTTLGARLDEACIRGAEQSLCNWADQDRLYRAQTRRSCNVDLHDQSDCTPFVAVSLDFATLCRTVTGTWSEKLRALASWHSFCHR
jgi:hypothetical protein